ncbi:MAG: M1 family aminopeptidase [Verrucomicrobiota bacterium]
MKQLFCAALVFSTALPLYADHFTEELACRKSSRLFAAPDASDFRKYAPSREVDILHLKLDVTPDFKARTISGTATITFKPIARSLQELRLDGIDLSVTSVTSTEKIENHQVTDEKVMVFFAKPIPPDKETSVTIHYSAEPTEGLYFRTPEMGYQEGETHLFTQGEAIEARHWYPCHDFPNEKFTSEMICHVPAGMTVLSNGKLVSEEKDSAGLLAVRWLQEKPHVNYLLCLVAGNFKKIEDAYKTIPLAFYTPPSDINEAINSFRDTKDMFAFFEKEIGVEYPWVKYFQVVVNDFVAGGMENTTLTTLTERTLFTSATENIRTSEGLVAHELAHQWFGDLVTCKDWSHLWLNEGFATFYALLYDEHKNGRDSMLYGLYGAAKRITGVTNDTQPIVFRNFDKPMEQFNHLVYQKGSWVLHMLRSQLGDDVYRRAIKNYLDRHQFDTVVTEDLNSAVEAISGRSFDQFFDQWVYHGHFPEIDATYSWDQKSRMAKVSIQQNQKLSKDVLLFNFPLKLRFKGKFGSSDKTVQVKNKDEDFYFVLPEAPETVRLDPGFELLSKINFKQPNAMLYAQLADKEDMVGRLLAIEQLAEKTDREAVKKLKQTLDSDAFHGVRVEASKALQTIHSDEALDALLASKQIDARVRNQLAVSIGGFFSTNALDKAQNSMSTEKNPDIRAQWILTLGNYPQPEVQKILIPLLDSKSYRNSLADAAISAMRTQDDPLFIEPIRDVLQRRESEFTSRGFSAGLDALAHLARNEKNRVAAREFLLKYVHHKKEGIKVAAISALGTLEDSQSIPVLETFANNAKDRPQRTAAEKAIAAIRTAGKPTDNLKSLRENIIELNKSHRETRKEMEALTKKLENQGTKSQVKSTRSPKNSQ